MIECRSETSCEGAQRDGAAVESLLGEPSMGVLNLGDGAHMTHTATHDRIGYPLSIRVVMSDGTFEIVATSEAIATTVAAPLLESMLSTCRRVSKSKTPIKISELKPKQLGEIQYEQMFQVYLLPTFLELFIRMLLRIAF